MKTTTKIMIGMLGIMVLMLIATISIFYYLSPEYGENGSGAITFNTSSKAITLPTGYKHIKWMDGSAMEQRDKSVYELQGILLNRSHITISSSDSASGNVLCVPEQLAKYLTVNTENDTLCIKFSATKEQMDEDFNKRKSVDIESAMQLNLLPEVENINLESDILQVSLENVNTDTLALSTKMGLEVNNCQIKDFTPSALKLKLNSGSIEKLNLDLDVCQDWEVADSCQIYHEILTGSSTSRIALNKHCKILEWKPKTPEVYVYFDLRRKAKIILE